MTRIVGGRIGDPTRETVGQPVAIVLPDPTTLFARRADRLASLADGHPMADWLRFMARVTGNMTLPSWHWPGRCGRRDRRHWGPLATDGHRRNPDRREGLHLLRALDDMTFAGSGGGGAAAGAGT
jgi:hypothetical protein